MQAILAPCPQVAEDEFLPQHIHLSIFRYGRRICEWLCSSKRHRCHNPQSPQRYFLCLLNLLLFFFYSFCFFLHAGDSGSMYRNTFTSGIFFFFSFFFFHDSFISNFF
ncbi:hypothetical protein AAZX31_15G193600 [Glycine max]